jgi:6-phosphogluconolactonase (cycloisomerase 2 family)
MKARIVLALLLAGGLAGCSSVGKQFAYVTGPGTPEIFQFQLHSNGSLSALSPANAQAGTSPASVVVHPSGSFAYIANFAGNTVTLLSVNHGNGQLTVPVNSNPIPPPTPANIFNTGTGPIAVAITPNGSFLYVLNQGSGNIAAFVVSATDGSLTAIPPPGNPPPSPFFGTLVAPTSIAVSKDGNLLFVASPSQHSITPFTIDSKGVLTQGAPVVLGVATSPVFVAIEPSGRFLYVADSAGNAVLGFSIQGNGALTPITGSPFPASSQPVAITTTPGGALLYVANQGSNNVSGFVIDSNSGALGAVAGSPFPTGGKGPTFLAATGTFVYVTENVTNDVAAFAIGTNGTLTAVSGSPFNVATQPVWIALGTE